MHLRELPMAAIALDELALAGDGVGLADGLLRGPDVALLALPVVGAVVAPEGRQPMVAQLPDAADRGVEEGPVMGRDQQCPGPPAEMLLEPLERAKVEVVG